MASQRYLKLLEEAKDLHIRKNAGYSGADNPDAWANFRMAEEFGVSAFKGCLVRMSDKYIRITNLIRNPNNEQVGESVKDTLKDLAAYALIAVCLLEEEEAKNVDSGCTASTFTDPEEVGLVEVSPGIWAGVRR